MSTEASKRIFENSMTQPFTQGRRGPNLTPRLYALAEDVVRSYSADWTKWEGRGLDRDTMMLPAARGLHEWATSIDHRVTQIVADSRPENIDSFEQTISEAVQEGKLSDSLNLLVIEKPNATENILGGLGHIVPWFVIKALFDIDTSGIDGGYYKGGLDAVTSIGGFYRPSMLDNDYMLKLIGDAVEKNGHKLEETSVPDQSNVSFAPPYPDFVPPPYVPGSPEKPLNAYLTPSGIEGVSFVLATLDEPAFITKIHAHYGGKGRHLGIWNIGLKFEPLALAAVRPLSDEDAQEYVDMEQRLKERVEQDRKSQYEGRIRMARGGF